jgi:hypothetical protein
MKYRDKEKLNVSTIMCETENNQQNFISTCIVENEDKESIKAGAGMLSTGKKTACKPKQNMK